MRRLIILLIPFLLCACSHDMNRREIDEIDLVLVLGIDYFNEEYTLSAVYSTGEGADPEEGAAPGSEEVMQGKGSSPFEALENLKLKNKKTISLAQTGYFLVGDGAAENGIDLCLDFLSRDETIKMESLVFITKDVKASDFINNGIENKQTVHEDIEAIDQKQQEMVTRNDNTLVNVINGMKQNYSSILIPYLISEEKSFLIEGYAVFDECRLRDYLDYDTSNGVNFVKDIIRSYPIYLDNQVGLSLSYSATKLKSKLKNNNINIVIQVDFETMIKEVNTDENIFTQEGMIKLRDEQNQYIKGIIEKAVNYSIASGLDIFEVARLIENQHVKEWGDIEKEWTDTISDIQYDYVLNSKITKSFILGNER